MHRFYHKLFLLIFLNHFLRIYLNIGLLIYKNTIYSDHHQWEKLKLYLFFIESSLKWENAISQAHYEHSCFYKYSHKKLGEIYSQKNWKNLVFIFRKYLWRLWSRRGLWYQNSIFFIILISRIRGVFTK